MLSALVSSVSTALDFNQATLSGCIDIIVIQQEDGTLKSTPFHVRFGRMRVLRSRNKTVEVWVNGIRTDLTLHLGAAGEAYFLRSQADVQEWISEDEEGTKRPSSASMDNSFLGESDLLFDPDELKVGFVESKMDDDVSTRPPTLNSEKANQPPSSAPATLSPSRHAGDTGKTGTPQRMLMGKRRSMDALNSPRADSAAMAREQQKSAIEVSLCGRLLTGNAESEEEDMMIFEANLVPLEHLARFPATWFDDELVFRFNGKMPFYPSKAAMPMIASWAIFGSGLPFESVAQLLRTNLQASVQEDGPLGDWQRRMTQNDGEIPAFGQVSEATQDRWLPQLPSLCCPTSRGESSLEPTSDSAKGRMRRTLRPSPEQLSKLHLEPGCNTIEFCVTGSRVQGPAIVKGSVYLWHYKTKIVVSDVDGTITKSDVWGQIMPIVGKDWSHSGVADFFSKIQTNGYKILYLTARAIGQADQTRDYLFGLTQSSAHRLPDGPLLLSPDRLFLSFKREVIDRKPYVFKIAALRDIRNLFPPHANPFYAGFGNRDTDHKAYTHIGIPEARVFIINSEGTVHHVNTAYAKTYTTMADMHQMIFPVTGTAEAEEDAEEMMRRRLAKRIDYRRVYQQSEETRMRVRLPMSRRLLRKRKRLKTLMKREVKTTVLEDIPPFQSQRLTSKTDRSSFAEDPWNLPMNKTIAGLPTEDDYYQCEWRRDSFEVAVSGSDRIPAHGPTFMLASNEPGVVTQKRKEEETVPAAQGQAGDASSRSACVRQHSNVARRFGWHARDTALRWAKQSLTKSTVKLKEAQSMPP